MATADDVKAALDAAFQKVSTLDDFEASVEAAFAAQSAAMDGLKQQILDLQTQIGNAADLTPLLDTVSGITAKLDDLQTRQAVLAGTPADPNAP